MTEQLDIGFGLEIVYVSGTVNGVAVDWTLTAPGVWSAIVDKAPDGRYEIGITAYNEFGTPTHYHTVIYKLTGLVPLKTDWTRDDQYGPDELNRVEADTQYVAELAYGAGYPVTLEDVVVDRDMAGYEFANSLSRVERNIDAIAQGFLPPPGYVQSKTWIAGLRHDYTDANRIERNLQLLHDWLVGTIASFRWCGTFTCGEDGGIY